MDEEGPRGLLNSVEVQVWGATLLEMLLYIISEEE